MTPVQPAVKRKRNRTAREEALVAAASKLFASRGYVSSTTREIAAAAGCAEGLIHRYFGGKEGLLLALIKHQVSQEVVDLGTLPLASTLADEVVQLVEWEVERTWQDREFCSVLDCFLSAMLIQSVCTHDVGCVHLLQLPVPIALAQVFSRYSGLAANRVLAVGSVQKLNRETLQHVVEGSVRCNSPV